jgi:hypothetical protein
MACKNLHVFARFGETELVSGYSRDVVHAAMKSLVYLLLISSALLGVSGAGGSSSVDCGGKGAVVGTASTLIFDLNFASGQDSSSTALSGAVLAPSAAPNTPQHGRKKTWLATPDVEIHCTITYQSWRVIVGISCGLLCKIHSPKLAVVEDSGAGALQSQQVSG